MNPFLKAEGLVKRYGRIHALRGVDLQVEEGQFLVLLGPNGAGKSTLLGVLAGRIRPTSGMVVSRGEVVGSSVQARARTGYLAHSSLLYSDLTARENLLFYGRLYGLQDAPSRADEMLRFMGLWERRDDRVRGFSKGMEQRLSIARTLLHDPELILMDEPFSGLDLQSSRTLASTLRQLMDGTRAMILATHDMAAVGMLGERVAIMSRGQIVHQGPVPRDGEESLKDLYAGAVPGGSL